MEQVRGRARVIAINNSVRLVPWADIAYACDHAWWKRENGLPGFAGLKLSVDRTVHRMPWGVRQVGLNKGDDRLELMKFGTVGWAGNSGFHCLNLAVQFMAAKIVLAGFDMTLAHGVHWHGRHTDGLNNPTERNVERWRRCIDAAAEVITALGIRCINVSPISALANYPKMSLEEALSC